jgi:hypothetical protein
MVSFLEVLQLRFYMHFVSPVHIAHPSWSSPNNTGCRGHTLWSSSLCNFLTSRELSSQRFQPLFLSRSDKSMSTRRPRRISWHAQTAQRLCDTGTHYLPQKGGGGAILWLRLKGSARITLHIKFYRDCRPRLTRKYSCFKVNRCK